MIVLLYSFIVLSALGLILSILIHIGTLLGVNVPAAMLEGLFIGMFVVCIPVAILKTFSEDYWKEPAHNNFKWMKPMPFVFVAYSLIFHFIFKVIPLINLSNVSDTTTSVFTEFAYYSDVREFSSMPMIFYSAAFSILYSVRQVKIEKKGFIRKCPNGHLVSLDTMVCEKCSQTILD